MARATLTAEQKAARETAKADNFRKLASKRVDKALQAIALLGPLANRTNYVYTAEQVEKIGKAFEQTVINTMAKFAPDAKAEAESGFQL